MKLLKSCVNINNMTQKTFNFAAENGLLFRRSGVDDLQIDLGLLRGLWHLYTDMSNDSPESSTVLDPVIRALTELFVAAETLAQVT